MRALYILAILFAFAATSALAVCPASPTSITTTLPYASNSVWTASFSTQLSAELPYASYSGCSTVSGSSRGKWWVYPSGAPRGSTIYASTCTRNTDITTVIQLFEGTSTCVTGVSEPVCNSSAVALDTARGCSTLSFVPESGKVYYIYVSGYQGTTGDFSLTVDYTPPAACFYNSQPISIPTVNSMALGNGDNTVNSTYLSPGSCSSLSTSLQGNWYTVAGDGNYVNLKICNTSSTAKFTIYEDSSLCNNCACTSCGFVYTVNIATCNEVLYKTTLGKNIYAFVTGSTSGSIVNYSYNFTRVYYDPPQCQSKADAIGLDSAVTGYLTPQTGSTFSSSSCSVTAGQRGKWYRIAASSSITGLYIHTCGSMTNFSSQVSVFSSSNSASSPCTTCDCLSCEGSANGYSGYATSSSCASGGAVYRLSFMSSSSDYYIFVASDSSTVQYGRFELFVSESSPIFTSSSSLAGGAIIGIVFGAFFGFVIILVLIVFCCLRVCRHGVVVHSAPATVVVQPSVVAVATPAPQPVATTVTQTTYEMQPMQQQPQYGQPMMTQPQYGQPQYGQPQYGQPQPHYNNVPMQQPGGYYT